MRADLFLANTKSGRFLPWIQKEKLLLGVVDEMKRGGKTADNTKSVSSENSIKHEAKLTQTVQSRMRIRKKTEDDWIVSGINY